MSVAVVITTHGKAAEELRHSAEMIIGEQENLQCLTFLPGENGDTLADKMRGAIAQLDTSKGILLLVDLWGGTPFNAASKVAQELAGENRQCEVVTGVNVPMLIETLMEREDIDDLNELTQTAVNSAREGVRSLNGQGGQANTVAAAPSTQAAPAQSEMVSEFDENDPEIQRLRAEASRQVTGDQHPVIALLRIDDRLIHGQVATRWTKERNVSRIIVVNDAVAADPMRVTMLKQAVPPGVSAHVVSLDKLVRVFNNPQYAGERVMLLFTNPSDILNLVERGLPVETVNIGGMAYREGKTQLDNAVSVDAQDVAAFKALNERGIELEVRKVASDNKVNVMNLIADKFQQQHT